MDELTHRTSVIKRKLEQAIQTEWGSFNHFPCYGNILPGGEPSLYFSDLVRYTMSPIRPIRRLSLLACWPLRLWSYVSEPKRDGLTARVRTDGRWVLRFHTPFLDFFLFKTIRRILRAPGTSKEDRARWAGILLEMAEDALRHHVVFRHGAEQLKVYEFFPPTDSRIKKSEAGSFFDTSGLLHMEPDADSTWSVFEMFADTLELLDDAPFYGIDEGRARAAAGSIAGMLDQAHCKFLRHYQFRSDGTPRPLVNYTDIEPTGGVTTFFTEHPEDAPDLVVNVNVLRSILVNNKRWNVCEDGEWLSLVRGIVDFLHRNVMSRLFRTTRGYSFYFPLIFCATYARLWRTVLALDPAHREKLDPCGKLKEINAQVLDYLRRETNPAHRSLNPFDAALSLASALQLGETDSTLLSAWVQVLCDRFQDSHHPYEAYEIFNGKVPTLTIYGSETTTASLVHYALSEFSSYVEQRGEPLPA